MIGQILSLILASNFSFGAIQFGNPNRDSREFTFAGLEKLRVESPAGKISVSPMPLNVVSVVFNWRNLSDECQAVAKKSVTQDTLEVSIVRPTGAKCEADIEIQIPANLALDLKTDAGAIDLRGMNGSLSFAIGSGSIVASGGVLKTVTGKSGSGRIDIKGLNGGGDITMGSGEVNVEFTADPKGSFVAQSGSGNINLLYPKGIRLNSQLSSAAGQMENDFGFDSQSNYAVTVKTGAGDIRVKSY